MTLRRWMPLGMPDCCGDLRIATSMPPLLPLMDASVLVIGAGPAALCIAAALAERGVQVIGLAPDDPEAPWANTYGIWWA